MVKGIYLSALRQLLDSGVLYRHYHAHDPSSCDGMLTCNCPVPAYSYRVTSEYRDALELERDEAR